MPGWRKELLLSLSKAQLTNNRSRTGLTISVMLSYTTNCSPSLFSMHTAWHLLANGTVLFRAVFVQLCLSRLSWEVSRLCGVANILLQLSAAAALFISLSLLCMVTCNTYIFYVFLKVYFTTLTKGNK